MGEEGRSKQTRGDGGRKEECRESGREGRPDEQVGRLEESGSEGTTRRENAAGMRRRA